MGRKQQGQADQLFNDSQNLYTTSAGNSQGLYGQLQPAFTAEATNPQGYGKAGLGAMNTASQQSVGGSTAGAVGEGDLTAARTRNAGGYQAANDEAVRSGQRQLSENAVGVQADNERLKQAQKQAGLSGSAGLYSGNQAEALGAIHGGTGAVNAGTDAGKSGWYQNFLATLNALKPGASGGGGGGTSWSVG